jgi:hypothetical protein
MPRLEPQIRSTLKVTESEGGRALARPGRVHARWRVVATLWQCGSVARALHTSLRNRPSTRKTLAVFSGRLLVPKGLEGEEMSVTFGECMRGVCVQVEMWVGRTSKVGKQPATSESRHRYPTPSQTVRGQRYAPPTRHRLSMVESHEQVASRVSYSWSRDQL